MDRSDGSSKVLNKPLADPHNLTIQRLEAEPSATVILLLADCY